MRSMSMLQLLGGVAAAGVVAAGATAFTASGVTVDAGVTNANKFLGGGVAVTATGTVVDGITYGYADGAKSQLNTVTLHFADTNAGAGKVTLASAGAGAAQPTWTCDDIGAAPSTASTSICTANASYQLSAANTVTTLTINVFPA
jgi:hypothetical protein